MRLRLKAALLATALLAAACGHESLGPNVATVVVTAAATTMEVRQSIQFTAQALDHSGAPINDLATQWSSSNPAVATVSASGLVTGLAAGTVTITATIGGTRGTVALTIVPIAVAAVAVIPDSAVLAFPSTLQLVVVITGTRGDTLARAVTWSSSNPGIASVSETGLVTTWVGGRVTITATSEGQRGTATIIVTVPVASVKVIPDSASLAVGTTRAVRAVVTGTTGEILARAPIDWSSSSSAVATVNPTGLVSGWTAGSATITATSGGKSGSAVVTVVPCGAVVSTSSLGAAPQSPPATHNETFVRLHDDVTRGVAPPRVMRRSAGAISAGTTVGCGQLELRVWQGQPGPEGGTLEPIAWANPAAFGSQGRLVFMAYINGVARNQGVFVSEGTSLRAIAIGCGWVGGGGQPGNCGDPTPAGGTFAGFFGGTFLAPATNDAGDVLFMADVYGASTPRGLFLYRAGIDSLVKVAAVGDTSPAGGVLSAVGPGSLDAQGNVVFLAWGATSDDQQILHWSNGLLTTIAHTGEPAPGGGTWNELVREGLGFVDGTFIPVGPLPDIDDAGRVAFQGASGPSRGLVVWEAGTASWYVLEGDPAPGGGTYANFWSPILGAGGEMTFLADVNRPTCCLSGWYAGRPGDWRKVLGHYDVVDGYQVYGIATSRNPMQPITPAGDVLVWVAVQLPDSSYREQLVIVRRDGTRESIAFQGQPGLPSGILEYFNPWASLDATGRATVSAFITGGASESAHLVRVP